MLISVLAAAPLNGCLQDTLGAPLFASHELLELTLEADFRALNRDRDDDRVEHPARIWFRDEFGGLDSLDIEVMTRGKFRRSRSICEFPPLRLDFPTSAAGGTLFAGQDKLKLVTHCDNGSEAYEQYLLKEYLIYRIYGLFTEKGFLVRLARISYVDTDEDRDSIVKYAFFIEDDEQLAARNGARILDSAGVSGIQADDEQATLFEVFQYFIGNADWSVSALHNVVLLMSEGGLFPELVPYDFDWSGLVDARYAVPPPGLGTYSVKERVFIAPCRPVYDLNRVIGLFNERREEIYELVRSQPGLSPSTLERSLEYFEDFYKCVNDARCIRRELIRRCPTGI